MQVGSILQLNDTHHNVLKEPFFYLLIRSPSSWKNNSKIDVVPL